MKLRSNTRFPAARYADFEVPAYAAVQRRRMPPVVVLDAEVLDVLERDEWDRLEVLTFMSPLGATACVLMPGSPLLNLSAYQSLMSSSSSRSSGEASE